MSTAHRNQTIRRLSIGAWILSATLFHNAKAVDYGKPAPLKTTVTARVIYVSFGDVVLSRKSEKMCAFVFLDAQREPNGNQPSFWHSGADLYTITYRWAELHENDLSNPETIKWTREVVKQGETFGPGKFGSRVGQIYLRCGALRLGWRAPTTIYFSGPEESYQDGDFGYEFAFVGTEPLTANQPTQITWYRYDNRRLAPVQVP